MRETDGLSRDQFITSLEQELTDTSEKMQNIINAIPGGVTIYKVSDIFETVYFSDGVPELSGYTVEEYRTLIQGDAAQLTYPEDTAMVTGKLREAIRDYLHAARGVICGADQVVIGAGNEYLLMLLMSILGKERTIAMENPTYKQAYRVLAGQDVRVVPVEMDGRGMRPDRLEERGADIAYVMPSHQFPTGIVMPVRRRQELLQWAGRRPGRFLIEDDYDSEFRYRGKPVPALQGMGGEDQVIYLGTFSQSVAPAIRISYMVLPRPLLEAYRERAGFYASTVSRIDQTILYEFLTGGHFERHLNRMRAVYRGKHDSLLAALKPLDREAEISGENAGIHLLLTHKSLGERELVRRAEALGVKDEVKKQ